MIDLTLYNYILIKPNLTIDYCDVCSDHSTTTYASNSAIVTAITQVKSDYSYLGGIIPITNDQEYIINVAKVKYYEQQLTYLYLRFANDYELWIDCVTNATALECYNIIGCIYKALNESTIYTNRVKWYVKEGITDSVSMKSFSEIQTAVTYLQNNGLSENAQVIVRSGAYNSFVVSSSLMIKFESDVTIAGGTVIQSLSNVNTTDAIYFVQNSENSNYYSPAIYVNNDTLLYARMTDRELKFYYSGSNETYSFLSYDTYLDAYGQYIEDAHRQLATIGSSDSYVYLVNMALVSAHSVLSTVVTVTYSTGDTLAITCTTSGNATNHNAYLGKVYTSYNIDDYLATKNILYVNPDFPTDTATQFRTISSAMTASSAGNLVYVENATHTASEVTLKNGIDIYCDNAIINCTTGNLFKDTSAVTCNIWGTAKINNTDATPLKSIAVYLQYGSNVYFEFDTVQTINSSCYSYVTNPATPSTLRVKGYSITSGFHGIDSDGYMAVYDVDVPVITAHEQSIYPANSDTTNVYYRNVKAINSNTGGNVYLDTSGGDYNFNGMNLRIRNNNGNCLDFPSNASPYCNLWNSFFQSTSDYAIDSLDPQTVTCYNRIYSNNPETDTITVTGDLTIKPYLNLN